MKTKTIAVCSLLIFLAGCSTTGYHADKKTTVFGLGLDGLHLDRTVEGLAVDELTIGHQKQEAALAELIKSRVDEKIDEYILALANDGVSKPIQVQIRAVLSVATTQEELAALTELVEKEMAK